ncbi:MAG TPA: flavin reductase family protein [Candidatus Avamphibacillus sp.]|nr:flavin reductase family protein [Candidatus Avamphibacillus sp.]
MLELNPTELTERENYKLLIGSIIPRPIAFVTSMANDGTVNGAPFSYFNVVSSNPPMISLSIQRRDGALKDTAKNILENREFVVHIVDEDNVEKVNETAATLKPDQSELKKANLTPVKSDTIEVPGVKEAKVRFECKLVQAIELGDNGKIGTDLLIGKIRNYHFDSKVLIDGKIQYNELKAMSRLAGSDYAKVGDILSIERPK